MSGQDFLIEFILTILLVSQDPANYDDAPTEGIRRVLEIVTGSKIPRGEVLNTDKIGAPSWLTCILEKLDEITLLFRLHSPLYNGCN